MDELYLEKPGQLKLREAARIKLLGDSEARVETIYGGICGSDIKVYGGHLPYASYPCRPGHEILGTIVEAGPGAHLETGTRVISFPNTYCGTCEFCLLGKTNICAEKKIFGVTVNGLFGQEIVVDSEFLVPVPSELTSEKAILTEPFAVIVHALKKTTITKGTSVAVVGCGTEGFLTTALLDYLGAEITAIDINQDKMDKAKSFYKSINTLHPNKVNNQQFDLVVEAAGTKTAIEMAFTLVKPGGTMITLGLTGDEVRFPSLNVTRSELSILGSIIYTKQDFQEAFEIIKDPGFNISPVLSEIVPFTQYEKAFADASTGNYTKIVLDFRDGR
ncbi:MAG: zinc-dependent alcohol dehydrogenase [Desulfocapsaceae bacterium]